MRTTLIKISSVILVIVLFLTAPLVFVAASLVLWAYWYRRDINMKNSLIHAFLSKDNGTLILIACLLVFATLFVHQTKDLVTQFGFPTTWVTYYGFPDNTGNGNGLNDIITRLAINPLQAILNFGMYYLLLTIIKKFQNYSIV